MDNTITTIAPISAIQLPQTDNKLKYKQVHKEISATGITNKPIVPQENLHVEAIKSFKKKHYKNNSEQSKLETKIVDKLNTDNQYQSYLNNTNLVIKDANNVLYDTLTQGANTANTNNSSLLGNNSLLNQAVGAFPVVAALSGISQIQNNFKGLDIKV